MIADTNRSIESMATAGKGSALSLNKSIQNLTIFAVNIGNINDYHESSYSPC